MVIELALAILGAARTPSAPNHEKLKEDLAKLRRDIEERDKRIREREDTWNG